MVEFFARDDFEKRGAGHTAREILTQAESWQKIPQLIAHNRDKIPFIADYLQDEGALIVFSGAGTSAYVGEIVAPCVNRLAKATCLALSSTDIVAAPEALLKAHSRGLVFSFARSGNSPESLDSLDKLAQIAPQMQAVGITCNADGALAKRENTLNFIMPEQTHDQSFVMTSSFSTMTLFASALCRAALGLPLHDYQLLSKLSRNINFNDTDFYVFDEAMACNRFVFLGSNALYGAAREGALKVLEMAAGRYPTMAETSLGFRHGPKSLIDEETCVFIFASNDKYTQQFDADIIRELEKDGRAKKLVVIASAEFYHRFQDIASSKRMHLIKHATKEILQEEALAVLAVQYAQIFGLFLALANDLSADNPCPSGEVNRVVQGVHLYPYQPSDEI